MNSAHPRSNRDVAKSQSPESSRGADASQETSEIPDQSFADGEAWGRLCALNEALECCHDYGPGSDAARTAARIAKAISKLKESAVAGSAGVAVRKHSPDVESSAHAATADVVLGDER